MEPATTMHRPATGAPIAGVCAAIADRTGIDPLIIRVAAVVLAVSSGMGVVLYLAAWVLIPLEGHERGPLLETFPVLTRAPRWALITAVAVVVVAVAAALGSVTSLSLFPAVVLGLVYYFGVHRPRRERSLPRSGVPPFVPPGPADRSAPGAGDRPDRTDHSGTAEPYGQRPRLDRIQPFGAPPQTSAPQSSTSQPSAARWPEGDMPTAVRPVPGAAAPSGGATPPATPNRAYDPAMSSYLTNPDPIGLYAPPPPRPRAPRLPDPQRVGKRTLALVTLTSVGLLWTVLSLLVSTGHAVPAFVWAASALVVVGGALVVGAWVGRPRGLIMAAVILGLIATVGAYQHDHPRLTGDPGRAAAPVSVVYTDEQTLPPADNWDFGRVTVDMSRLETTRDLSYDAHMGAGSLTVLVPADARVVVNAQVGMGTLQLGDQSTTSSSQENATSTVLFPGAPGAPTITVNGSTDLGELVVKSR
ncbi:PspC domain-containing protein [Raineyella sp. W15-4]|uniref:PspC domain-containing protein n=1 Tax=Raineyella sp. W15-4 TaxID=3081651 RepID=UPI0029555380|nr:PspC domain-containing protein [Raineyella sp. W15-4]WOQ17930.1 PspC domain-containing protein [Raineyella sp. W15-4]